MTAPHHSVDRGGALTTTGLLGPAGVAVAALGAASLLRVHDPHGSGSYGFCPFLLLTGQPCPGCGGLRAVNDLTRGDVAAAASSNLLVVAGVAATAVLWVVWVVRRARGDRQAPIVRVTTAGALTVLAVGVLFGVVRVTPWGSWLAP